MSKAKHTPKVVYAGCDSDGRRDYRITCTYDDLPPIPFGSLIAAAPEMLEALKALLPLCEEAMSAPRYRSDAQKQALADGHAAIRKAEGKEVKP